MTLSETPTPKLSLDELRSTLWPKLFQALNDLTELVPYSSELLPPALQQNLARFFCKDPSLVRKGFCSPQVMQGNASIYLYGLLGSQTEENKMAISVRYDNSSQSNELSICVQNDNINGKLIVRHSPTDMSIPTAVIENNSASPAAIEDIARVMNLFIETINSTAGYMRKRAEYRLKRALGRDGVVN